MYFTGPLKQMFYSFCGVVWISGGEQCTGSFPQGGWQIKADGIRVSDQAGMALMMVAFLTGWHGNPSLRRGTALSTQFPLLSCPFGFHSLPFDFNSTGSLMGVRPIKRKVWSLALRALIFFSSGDFLGPRTQARRPPGTG